MPDAIITSTASTFGTITGTFAADQSTITGTVSGIITGTLSGSVGVPGPQGPTGPQGPIGPEGPPGEGGTWGSIVGDIENQVDLWSELGSKYPASNPSGFITASALSPYLTTATANATFQTLAGMSSYLTTSAAAAGYYPLSGNPSGFLTAASLSGYATESWVTSQGYLTSSNLIGYATEEWVNSQGFLTSTAGLALLAGADFTGRVTVPSAILDGEFSVPGFNIVPTQNEVFNMVDGDLWVYDDEGLTPSKLRVCLENNTQNVATESWVTTVFAPKASPVFTGNPTAPTPATSDNDTSIATTAFVKAQGYAPLASPAFTGNPTAPTAALADNDTSIATTAFVQQELLSGTANARNLEVYVRNQTGSTITAGAIVYINGATGNRPTITLAQANNDANSAQTFGFAKTAIANNGFGFVIVRGELENIDTSALTEGVQLYLSPTTPGTWTTTKPSAPQHLVYVGIVVRAHPTQGVILVAIQNGYELGEIHDIQLGTLANNDLLAYESSTDLWKNKTFGALGLLTSSALTGYATESWVTAGLTFTGKVTGTATATSAAFNIGTVTAAPTTLVNGDIWITDRLSFRNRFGNTITGLTNNQTNTISTSSDVAFILGITQNGNGGGLRVVNNGTGDSFRVEDETPESTPFVISNSGRVGIGVTPDATAALKVDAGGIKFNDGTTQTTAPVAGPTYVNVQVFGGPASSGSFTWNKPTGAKSVEVLMMSGGGGGGSGARQATTAGRFGGGGGGGAGGIYFKLDADSLGSSETVTVGAGGAGGTAVAADSTNGNPGTKGGDSVFGPITCRGGNFGGGGTDTTGAAGATSLWYQWISNLVTVNNRGGVAPAAAPGIVYDHFYSSTGGGGGASRLANVTLPSGGGAGGNKLAATGGVESGLTSAIVGGAGGLGGTSTPPVAGTNGTEYWGGTGGGGGYYRPSTVGNPGAAGGWPGGGGGGGGCSDNSFNSGAGGAGGNGVVVVITYCS